MGVLGYFLYLLFPAFIVADLARIQITSFIGVALLDVVVGIFALGYIASVFIKRNFPTHRIATPFLLVVLAFTLSLTLSSYRLQADQLFFSSLYLFRYIAYATVLLWVVESRKAIKEKIQHFMLFSGAGIVILGLVQFVFYKDLKVLYALGWDDHLYRLFSTFLDPNFAGMFFVLFLIFQLPILIKVHTEGKKVKRLLLLCLAQLTTLSIFLTYSRTAYVMAIVGVTFYLLLSGKKRFAVAAFAIIIVGIGLFANTRVEGLNPFRTASTTARLESIRNAVTIIQDNPLFGVGYNAYRYAQIRYQFRQEVTVYPTHADSGTDNSFLFVLATSGVIGLLAYLYLLYNMGYSAYSSKSFLGKAFLVSIVSWSVGSFFINGLFYPELMFWMWCFYALTQE